MYIITPELNDRTCPRRVKFGAPWTPTTIMPPAASESESMHRCAKKKKMMGHDEIGMSDETIL